jgi:glyoxylase-like metal-dependent hydrolase (beta-lactamase superfamily II)
MLMVARDVYQLPLTPRSGVNAYLVGDVLVDSGYPLHTKKLLRETSSRTIHAHALTHAHADHAGGSKKLKEIMGIPVWVGASDAEVLRSGRAEPGEVPFGRSALKSYMKFPGVEPDRELREGDQLAAGFVALETPGHSPGHLAYWRAEDGTLICGDVFFNMSLATTAVGLHMPPGFFTPDPAQNRASARRLAALEPKLVLFGHGPPLRDPAALSAFAATLSD